MPTSPRLGLQKWSAGFTQSDIILNADIDILDIFVAASVRSRTETAPLGGDASGDCYIMPGGTLTGAFSTFSEHDLVRYDGTTWAAFTPVDGLVARVQDDNNVVAYGPSSWVVISKSLPLDKLNATAAPTVNDDVDLGYSVGSHWYDVTNDKAYVCLDATDGAAVWKEITASGGGGGGLTAQFKSSAYTASSGDQVFVDCSGGAVTITLPASPSSGDQVVVLDSSGDAGTSNITVGRNSETIDGAAADFVIDQDYGQVAFAYDGSDWKIAPVGGV